MELKDIKSLCYDAYLAGIDEADLGSPTMGTFAEWWQREKPAPTLSPTVTPVFDGSTIRCGECNHEIGFIWECDDITAYHHYGPRCPGCGKLIDKEVKR